MAKFGGLRYIDAKVSNGTIMKNPLRSGLEI